MFNKVLLYSNRSATGTMWGWPLIIHGIACIAFGLLVVAMPQLLVALVAGAFIFLGALLVFFGIQANRTKSGVYR